MADGDNQDQPESGSEGAGAVTRPEYIPETIWDAEKNAPKIDLAATLTEHETLKAANAERAAKIPAKPDDYKLELPNDFQLPEGYKWQVDPKDPLVAGLRTYAIENKLTTDEVSGLVKLYATHQANELVAQKAFEAEQTKALGANAEQRRAAAKTWIAGITDKNPEEAAVLTTLLDYAAGVKAIERIIQKAGGVSLEGNPGDNVPLNRNAEKAKLPGTPGGGRALLDSANSRPKN